MLVTGSIIQRSWWYPRGPGREEVEQFLEERKEV